mmetsp:Transcript_33347/g.65053  ORF Transcript_33347/g.65053 Transcript_33347/m.65053 type:complete len:177 (+) Transcript_33347:44-574(+)
MRLLIGLLWLDAIGALVLGPIMQLPGTDSSPFFRATASTLLPCAASQALSVPRQKHSLGVAMHHCVLGVSAKQLNPGRGRGALCRCTAESQEGDSVADERDQRFADFFAKVGKEPSAYWQDQFNMLVNECVSLGIPFLAIQKYHPSNGVKDVTVEQWKDAVDSLQGVIDSRLSSNL